jgi:hypothetical protein
MADDDEDDERNSGIDETDDEDDGTGDEINERGGGIVDTIEEVCVENEDVDSGGSRILVRGWRFLNDASLDSVN